MKPDVFIPTHLLQPGAMLAHAPTGAVKPVTTASPAIELMTDPATLDAMASDQVRIAIMPVANSFAEIERALY